MKYYMGIDVGTSSVKTILMTPDGKVVDIAQALYDVERPRPEWAEIPLPLIWEATKDTLRQLFGRDHLAAGCIQGISFSGQMHSLVMLDSEGAPLWNAVTWLDNRAAREAEAIDALFLRAGYRDQVLNEVTPGFFVAFLAWFQAHEPRVWERVRQVMLVKDYIRYRICGEYGTDCSDASGTVIFDMVRRQWAWEAIDALQFPREWFPEVHNAQEIAGQVTRACARETGLREGTAVCFGGGDTLMNHIGNGVVSDDGRILSTIGTSSHVSCHLPAPRADALQRAPVYCHALPGSWLMLCGGSNGGVVMKWLKDNIFRKALSFDEMSAVAAAAPAGAGGVICVPYLNGVTNPNDPAARALYIGLGLEHDQAHFVRSTMEGVIYILKKSLAVLEENGVEGKSVIATGGGSKDEVLLQIQADMYNLPVIINQGLEISCMGAAISAAVGTGCYATYEQACDAIVRFSPRVIEPIPANAALYDSQFGWFVALYEQNKAYFSRGQTINHRTHRRQA